MSPLIVSRFLIAKVREQMAKAFMMASDNVRLGRPADEKRSVERLCPSREDALEASVREFAMTASDFVALSHIVQEVTGIVLGAGKQGLLYARVSSRLRELKLDSFAQYIRVLRDSQTNELACFVNLITTNHTAFFREPHHFAFLAEHVVPEILRRRGSARRLRCWSAGCSSGEEAYSLALTLAGVTELAAWDSKILATDIDANVLDLARLGHFSEQRLEAISTDMRADYFRQVENARWAIADSIRQQITFKHLNLMERWPMQGPFQVIFCRNVLIYFDESTQARLFNRFADMLDEGGYLFLGHAENLSRFSQRYVSCGKTIYRKVH